MAGNLTTSKPNFYLAAVCSFLLFLSGATIGFYLADALLEWLVQLVATFAGAVLAAFAGIGLFKWQANRTEENRRQQLTSVVMAELQSNLKDLENGKVMDIPIPNQPDEHVVATFVQPLILEGAALSGLYEPVVTEDMVYVASLVRAYNNKVGYLMDTLPKTAWNEGRAIAVRYAVQNVENARTGIIKDSKILIDRLAAL